MDTNTMLTIIIFACSGGAVFLVLSIIAVRKVIWHFRNAKYDGVCRIVHRGDRFVVQMYVFNKGFKDLDDSFTDKDAALRFLYEIERKHGRTQGTTPDVVIYSRNINRNKRSVQ